MAHRSQTRRTVARPRFGVLLKPVQEPKRRRVTTSCAVEITWAKTQHVAVRPRFGAPQRHRSGGSEHKGKPSLRTPKLGRLTATGSTSSVATHRAYLQLGGSQNEV